MSKDLNEVLKDWDHDSGGISARWIQGSDGHPKVQLRVNLGVLQMEVKGRPDGQQPGGQRSLLDLYQEKQPQDGSDQLVLGVDDCSELQQEALQFYYRYLAFYALQYLDGVVDDTYHNLALIDLVSAYAADDDLAWQFLQFYPYVRMMNARARAEKLLHQEDFDSSLKTVNEALDDIRHFTEEYEDIEANDETGQEVEILQDLRRRIHGTRPQTEEEQLKQELSNAIQSENYERAATLRDALSKLDTSLLPAPENEQVS